MSAIVDNIRVVLVEDQHPTREALAALIGRTPGFTVVGSYGSMEDAIEGLRKAPADVALADIGLPGMSGIEGVQRLKAEHANTRS